MKKLAMALLCAAALAGACGRKRATTATGASKEPIFTPVEIPSVYSDPASKALWLAGHFWDKTDLSDTLWLAQDEKLEAICSEYVNILEMTPDSVAHSSMYALLGKVSDSGKMLSLFYGAFDHSLGDPNSPLRNEELLIPVLEEMVASPQVDTMAKVRPAHQLKMALRNRVGTPAADFTYTLANGSTGRLYGIKAPYTMLYFFNPDCHSCKEIRETILSSPTICGLQKKGRLTLLAVYVDEDLDIWRKYQKDTPKWWINSRDASYSLTKDEIYDLKAIPTMYLLDKDKTVLFKDTTVGQIEKSLAQLK